MCQLVCQTLQSLGRTSTWDTATPNPVDNINNVNHIGDTTLFGKRVIGKNVRRLIRRVNWTQGTRYEMYRHDYSVSSPSPITQSSRLYDARYYVMNENFNVYICIDNGSSGINTTGNASQDVPTFTDLEPSKAVRVVTDIFGNTYLLFLQVILLNLTQLIL